MTRCAILEQDDEAGRVLGSANRLPPTARTALSVKLAYRNSPACSFQQHGDRQHHIVDHRVAQRFGLGDVQPAFVDRHPSTDGEYHNRDDKCPEIEFAAIAEGMRGV